jgi:Na+/phosphate symporter
VLVRHRPLLANREIVAGRMSVFFCALFTLGAMLAGFSVRKQVLYTGAVVLGLTMTAIALALLIRAHLRRASLRALRARLESELAGARM